MFDAMVLAAGLGTRLRPLTEEIPKPLLPVGNIPLIARILRELHEAGAQRLVANAHHLSEKLQAFSHTYKPPVHVIHEPKILGTAGGIAGARNLFGERPLLLINGDILGSIPVQHLLAEKHDELVMAVVPCKVGTGTVGIDAHGRVARLRGEVFGKEVTAGDYTGMARLSPDCVRALPSEGCLVGDWALPTLRNGGTVKTRKVKTSFIDIGTPANYLHANLNWLRANGSQPISPSAQISANVELVESIVGQKAQITGQGQLQRCVVLPGALATAPLSDAIVLPSGRVVQVA